MELKCEPLIEGGPAAGVCLALTAPISFWGGVNPVSGEIIDARHPQRGLNIAGTILALPAPSARSRHRPSCSSWSMPAAPLPRC